MTDYTVFHAKKNNPFRPCMDGLFAAYASWLATPNTVLVPGVYGNPPQLDLKEGDTIYLLDLTYPPSVIEAWSTVAQVVILDHHKGAMNDLQYLSQSIYREFDMNRSGAVLAWQYFHPDKEVPELFRYVQDRDLWVKAMPDTDYVSLGLSELMHEKEVETCINIIHELLDNTLQNSIDSVIEIGKEVYEESQKAIANACSRVRFINLVGYTVPFVITYTDREKQAYSEIGNRLCRMFPNSSFAVVQSGDGYALRSTDNQADVQLIAKQLGGCGHRNASGCKAMLPYRLATIEDRFIQMIKRG